MFSKLITRAALALALVATPTLGACANGVPLKSNMDVVWMAKKSACRYNGGYADDPCIQHDFKRCVAFIDYSNPGRDETTYMAVTNALGGIAGMAAGYSLAGVTGEALGNTVTAGAGSYVGQALGTLMGYAPMEYRQAVETCMYAMQSDPKLVESAIVKVMYSGHGGTAHEFTGGQSNLPAGPQSAPAAPQPATDQPQSDSYYGS